MTYDPKRHHRRSVRIRDYDYAQPGAYFVTICSAERASLFGQVIDGDVRLSSFGAMVERELARTAELRLYVAIDASIVMPNHVHAVIFILTDDEGMARHAPTRQRFGQPDKGALSTVVGAFKSASTRQINAVRGTPGAPVWQRGFWDHVVRDDAALDRIRTYVAANPINWETDDLHPNILSQW